ncbi:L-proline glycine betaine binding ABC transporter protein ProX (TC 3.A.1.12.1) / Osmotic adaptation [Richelia intracellularis]|nr:L-proline glycine betaine binding ABC transporter protein ProX (TC 3.A.1.12.1) / Osmotic adaptation [Richelia intracellularis]
MRTGEHIIIVAIAITLAIAIGVPAGIFITRNNKFATLFLGVANIIQTIPSLAIFGFLISLPFLGGIGKTPAVLALILYALLPIIRNTYIGISSIDLAIRETGRGMGMTDRQLLFQVDIPLALSIIIAGVRVATVISVAIATIAAAIGGGGLGVFIFRGLATLNNQLILIGAIPSAVIAFGADFCLSWLENYLGQQEEDHNNKYRFLRTLSLSIISFLLAIVVLLNINTSTITIGSKNSTEQIILGEIIAQKIEEKTDIKVDRRFNLGGTFICHQAIKMGEIDGYVEYTGTALTAVLQQKPISDPKVVYQLVKQAYDEKFKLEVMEPLGFENTYAIVIRREDAEKLHIKRLSEAAKYSSQWQAGFGYEFLEREDGYRGLSKTYDLKLNRAPQQMDLGLMYKALGEKKIDIGNSSSTNGMIKALNLVILEDDKKYFPPYEAVPIFNQRTLEKYPSLRDTIEQLFYSISVEEMQQMNYQVDKQSVKIEQVARNYLNSHRS